MNTPASYKTNILENVQWIIIPLHIGDPIWWRHLASDVSKIIGLLISVAPLATRRDCVPHPGMHAHC